MILHRLAIAAAATAMLAAAPAAAAAPSQLIVFGDSLVDAGNIFLATGGFGPTNVYNNPSRGYFPGRFTNGPDYTDLLSLRLYGTLSTASLAGGSNYAFGGATAVTNADPVPDLVAQLATYSAGHAVDANALYILNFGGNDDFAIEGGAVPAALVPAYTAALVNSIAGAVQALDAGGATRILVTGIPNTTPTGAALDAALQSKLDSLTLTNATLLRFSYQNFFTRLAADPARYGVAPFTQAGACFDHLSPPATADCSGYFSVDGTHPIAPIQAAIYREVAHIAGIGLVPEPASWALMVSGFGVIGSAMRRQRVALA